MPKCEWCGKKYDKDEAEDRFTDTALNYSNLRKNLCGECAVEAIEDKADGVYFETCEVCGKIFDLIEDSDEFDSNFSDFSGTELRDYLDSNILCCDCALKEAFDNNI